MGSVATQVAGPEFGRCRGRGVDDQLIGRLVKRRCCFQAEDVGAVSELGLRVAADHIDVFNSFDPSSLLFFVAHVEDSQLEHSQTHPDRDRVPPVVVPEKLVFKDIVVFEVLFAEFGVFV